MNAGDELVGRLDQVEARLTRHAMRAGALAGLTDPDRRSGERWAADQVFAHLAEFGSYWLDQAGLVLRRYARDPVPFGRVKTDPQRIAAIADGRSQETSALVSRCQRDIGATREFIAGLDSMAWSVRGVHPTLGVMDMGRLLDEFLVGHYEEHCAQLDGLATEAPP